MTENTKVLTAKLVAAYLENNTLAAGDIPALIQSTYAALLDTASPETPPVEQSHPAVSVRKSVTADAIICLDCGKRQKMLKRHIHTAHGLTVDEYRAKWALPADYPMVAPDYAAQRSRLALDSGLGRKKSAEVETATDEVKAETPVPRRKNKYPASRWSKPSE